MSHIHCSKDFEVGHLALAELPLYREYAHGRAMSQLFPTQIKNLDLAKKKNLYFEIRLLILLPKFIQIEGDYS